MSTIKISDLPEINHFSTNTGATLFVGVDLATGTTGKANLTTLGEGLYAFQPLKVGQNQILYPNTIGQFSGNSNTYLQVNHQNYNANGSTDYVASTSDSDNSTKYIDFGIDGPTYNDPVNYPFFKPYDGYFYVYGPSSTSSSGNLIVGTASSNSTITFITGISSYQNIVAKITSTGLSLNTQSYITFGDGSIQTVAYNAGTEVTQNTRLTIIEATNISQNARMAIIEGTDVTQNTSMAATDGKMQSAYNLANTAVQNTAIIQLQALTLTGNLIANSIGQGIFVDKFTSNSATFSQNMVVLGNLTANTLLGNIFFSNVTTQTTQSNSILWTTQAASPTQQTAQLWYYGNTQSLILDTDIAGDRLSISKVLFFRGYNNTGVTIPANSFVRLTSGVTANQIPYIGLADATTSANATVAGFVKVPIAAGAYGFAYSQGIVEDLDTTGLGSIGDILFLSATPGQSSNVAPVSPNTVVQLGRIVNSNATLGKLFIQTQLRQAYGRTNGSLLYAFANNITSSNTISINDATGVLNANTIIANTFVYGSATANAMVTQLSSKSTAVTANGISGQITMNNAALAGQAYVTFTVNNSYVKHVNDIPFVAVQNSVTTPNPYQVCVGGVAVGSFNITVLNADSGGGSSHSDAIVLNWGLMRVGN